MNILGIKIFGHDTGAALISGQRIIAIAEERLNRVKHSPNSFPHLSIQYCLDYFNLKARDVDIIVIDQTNLRSRVKMLDIFQKETTNRFSRAEVHIVNHHSAHAASAFFCSPFQEAAVLVYDGTGEKFATHLGVYATETDALYFGQDNQLHLISKNLHLREERFFPYTFGVGKMYSRISDYLGFGSLNEGKLMGLAAYGNDSIIKMYPPEQWCKEYNGQVVCNSRITFPQRTATKEVFALRTAWPRFRRKLTIFLRPAIRVIIRHFAEIAVLDPDIFATIQLPKPRRSDEKLPDGYYASVAYAAQTVFEHVAVILGNRLRKITRSPNLCIAGGCGLNIDANRNFLDKVGFENIFVQPASSDTGIPLGLALHGYHSIAGLPRFYQLQSASLGRPYSESEILDALKQRQDDLEYSKPANLAAEVASLIAQGRIIGWFYGGAEYGPRALGHRSILADARQDNMKDLLNNKVKNREPWRPFAASVLEERVGDFFDFEGSSPFMTMAARVKKEKDGMIPSVTHVDGTCRIQTVTASANGRYYDLIRAFYDLTGVSLVLNTSFNLGGEPIVETPQDAIRTFLATQMDYLVLENYLIQKRATH